MNTNLTTLLSAASAAQAAAGDIIEAVRDGDIQSAGSVGSGETSVALADAMRLLLDATNETDEDANQLHGALVRFIEARN